MTGKRRVRLDGAGGASDPALSAIASTFGATCPARGMAQTGGIKMVTVKVQPKTPKGKRK